jgi:hypothetical protein
MKAGIADTGLVGVIVLADKNEKRAQTRNRP